MTEKKRVKFTLLIAGKHIDHIRTQRAHILCDTPHLIMTICHRQPKSKVYRQNRSF